MSIELFSAYIPNVATMAFIAKTKHVNIPTGEFYQKQTYRNRTKIVSANGVLNLSIPIIHASKDERLLDGEVCISYDEKWQLNHWKSFVSAYNSSPFFEYYQDELEEVFFTKKKTLVEFNLSLIKLFMDWFEIDTEISLNPLKKEFNILNTTLINSKKELPVEFPRYIQVFESKFGFIPNLNALDLISNLGPESSVYLNSIDLTPMQELS